MAVLIEKTFGRKKLIEVMCNQRLLLATYNEAIRRSKEPLPVWSEALVTLR